MTKQPGKVLVGISSWTEPTLVKSGTFYPKEAKTAEGRLRFYASQFPIVEVDSSYYYPPSERNAALWAERTPTDFTFNVKAYSLLTQHPTKVDSLFKEVKEALPEELAAKPNVYADRMPHELVQQVWERFASALMPLHSAGKLGSVLFQFPQYFVISHKNKDYLVECQERLPDFRICVEFRHKSWMEERNREETLSFLEKHDLPYVCVDMPQGFVSSIPPVAAVTSRGPVASVAIYTRREPRDIRTIAMDSSSRTSVALATILLRREFRVTPQTVSMAPDVDTMLAAADAALIIGDTALFYDHRTAGLQKIDLGEMWTSKLGLPFVYAFWAGWPRAVEPQDAELLQRARAAGVAHADEVAAAYYPDDIARQAVARRYLHDNIQYFLGAEEYEGLREFYRYAAELDLVAFDGELRIYHAEHHGAR